MGLEEKQALDRCIAGEVSCIEALSPGQDTGAVRGLGMGAGCSGSGAISAERAWAYDYASEAGL